jgi:hypothetical protein
MYDDIMLILEMYSSDLLFRLRLAVVAGSRLKTSSERFRYHHSWWYWFSKHRSCSSLFLPLRPWGKVKGTKIKWPTIIQIIINVLCIHHCIIYDSYLRIIRSKYTWNNNEVYDLVVINGHSACVCGISVFSIYEIIIIILAWIKFL